MTNNVINQAINQIKSAGNILVLVPSGSSLDAVAAGLALREFLLKNGKNVRILTPSPLLPKLKFLPESSSLLGSETLAKNLVIEVSLERTEPSELTYHKQDDKLKIFLTPKSGEFEATDVAVKTSVYPFDLILTLGIPNLEELGKFYSTHAQMFFDTTVINIDHKPSNENYGQINLVALTASAVSEVVFDLLGEYDANLLDEKIATLLLAGLISQTNSFQSRNSSPQIFLKASKLVDLGGKQQEIISQLYRSKSLGLLHLWGRVLARLKQDDNIGLVYSAVSMQDVERSGALSTDLDEIIFEMVEQLSFAKYFVFFSEGINQTVVFIATTGSNNLIQAVTAYKPQFITTNIFKFTVGKPILDAEKDIISVIEKELGKS
jgi:nanoRNase/pAp phosphatase (c-di-AMP/oligoRNAs hydrolase)